VNIDGAIRDYPDLDSCTGIFKGNRDKYINNFSALLGV